MQFYFQKIYVYADLQQGTKMLGTYKLLCVVKTDASPPHTYSQLVGETFATSPFNFLHCLIHITCRHPSLVWLPLHIILPAHCSKMCAVSNFPCLLYSPPKFLLSWCNGRAVHFVPTTRKHQRIFLVKLGVPLFGEHIGLFSSVTSPKSFSCARVRTCL